MKTHVASLLAVACAACGHVIPGHGGGMIEANPARPIDAGDVIPLQGFAIEPVAANLVFPTGITWDAEKRLYVVESGYSYGEVFTEPRLVRVEPGGKITVVARGEKNGPWNGVVFHQGAFWVAEGGAMEGGRLLKITPDGKIERVVEGVPTGGDHHLNGPIAGPDGAIYFASGSMTNSGIVGEDSKQFGWLGRHPEWHDVPCADVTLTGENFETPDVLQPGGSNVMTGAFQPFGTATTQGQVVPGKLPCSGAVMRVPAGGGAPELVAWGFRNPFGMAFSPDGKLYITDNGYDTRGSRPIWGAADWLWRVDTQAAPLWYGWPDHSEGRPVTESRYQYKGKQPTFLLAAHPNPPPKPVALFGCHSSSDGIDFSRNAAFGFVGQAFVAQFGDQMPTSGKVIGPSGYKVVRVDVTNGVIEEFVVNRGKGNGPASKLEHGGLERPVAVRFDPDGTSLYIVDFGIMTMDEKGPKPMTGTGTLWRVYPAKRGA